MKNRYSVKHYKVISAGGKVHHLMIIAILQILCRGRDASCLHIAVLLSAYFVGFAVVAAFRFLRLSATSGRVWCIISVVCRNARPVIRSTLTSTSLESSLYSQNMVKKWRWNDNRSTAVILSHPYLDQAARVICVEEIQYPFQLNGRYPMKCKGR